MFSTFLFVKIGSNAFYDLENRNFNLVCFKSYKKKYCIGKWCQNKLHYIIIAFFMGHTVHTVLMILMWLIHLRDIFSDFRPRKFINKCNSVQKYIVICDSSCKKRSIFPQFPAHSSQHDIPADDLWPPPGANTAIKQNKKPASRSSVNKLIYVS